VQYTEADICGLAEELTCRIAKQMFGMDFRCVSAPSAENFQKDTVQGFLNAPVNLELQFKASPQLFYQMAKNAIGDEPEDEFEVQEYAMEFFNVICGRFVSKLKDHCRHNDMRFRPPVYLKNSDQLPDAAGHADEVCRVYFENADRETAEFCWNRNSMNKLWTGSEE